MADEKNNVFVELYDLSITDRKDDRFGKVITNSSVDEDDLIKMAVKRRTDISPTTMKASLELLKNMAIERLLNGDHVKFGLGFFYLDVKGLFLGDNASWDSTKHRLVVKVLPTGEVKVSVKEANVKVRGMATVGTVINTVTDVTTQEVNTVLTRGGGVNLTGSKMRIAGDKDEIGIYLVNNETQDEVLIQMTSVLTNDPSKISFILPHNIEEGEFKIKITTQYSSGNTLLKEPRSYTFEYPMTLI